MEEASEADRLGSTVDHLAYRAVLLILRDYMSSGYYPIINNERCFLAPVFESPELNDRQRRAGLMRLYRTARDRALVERGHLPWLRRAAEAITTSAYAPDSALDILAEGPPRVRLERAIENGRVLDTRGLWRAVRSTWTMGVEASAPGREVAFVAFDERVPETPLGILQFRNVVPEIMQRDRWFGVAIGTTGATDTGYIGILASVSAEEARRRVTGTADVFRRLRAHVLLEGLPLESIDEVDPGALYEFAKSRRERFRDLRRSGDGEAHLQLAVIKRAETVADLTRGILAADEMLAADEPRGVLVTRPAVARDFDAGLKKIWHYHMGFVAMELSVCGAAPPFGPLRVGKLMAGLAGCADVINAWGTERPLGQIASTVYRDDVRSAVPNPGPLVIFTSGLFPGHSAQYNRATSGSNRWRKIGETAGFGSFHVAVDTVKALTAYNDAVDGYAHITRTFGEGSSPRFRAVGRALTRLGLPDLRRHEVRRPLYALPLVDDPAGVLLGWCDPRTVAQVPDASTIAGEWWSRWVGDRAAEFAAEARTVNTLRDELLESAGLENE